MSVFTKSILGLVAVLCLTGAAPGELVRVEVEERSDVLAGKPFGSTGAYERIVGKVHFEVDPKLEANRRISDLDFALRNARGRVEFSADLYLLLPKDPAKGNGTVFYEVVNRGRKGLLGRFNVGATGSYDPRTEAHFGDGYLLEEGYSVVWMGWQYDVAQEPNLMRVHVPAARDGERPITGLVRSDYVPDRSIYSFHLADRQHAPYPVINPDDPEVQLTVRDRIDAPRRIMPRDRWLFAREEDGKPVPNRTHVFVKAGLEPGKIYEIVYRSQDPALVGLGLAATRDLITFFKHGSNGGRGEPLAEYHKHVKQTLALGSSQSGRFLRTFLYFGFNADEKGRQVFDGVWSHVAGGGRGSFNHRFAQPSRDARPHFNFLYPTDIFPFTDEKQTDPETGLSEGILDRVKKAGVVPKIYYTNSSYEYYGRSASLIHTAIDGREDFPPSEKTRIYLFAGAQHGPGRFPPGGQGVQNLSNANDFTWGMRGLLAGMQKWLAENKEPPPSQYPSIANGSLAPLSKVEFPKIPGVAIPERMHHAYRVFYGPEFRSKGIVTIEPPEVGRAFPMKVPQVDGDGNETSGIRLPVIRVPLATYTGWNLRDPSIGAPKELYSMRGSYIPFSRTKAEREKTGDPRLSMEERYGSRKEYVSRLEEEARKLAEEGYVLKRDVPLIVEQAAEQWDHYMVPKESH